MHAGGRQHSVACFTVNDNDLRPGLDAIPEPTFVLRADGKIVFANEMAMRMFGFRVFPGKATTLTEYLGIEFDLQAQASSEDAFQREARQITVRDKLMLNVGVTARKILFRDEPFFVVVTRPC